MKYVKKFGEYELPDEWIETDIRSQKMCIYTHKEHEENDQKNHISITFGENNYSAKEHREFRNSILEKFDSRLRLYDRPKVNAYGEYSKKGLTVYVMKVREPSGRMTAQYYIVGDHRFCMAQEINYDGGKETDKVAKDFVDSFEWKAAVNE
ncbi:MAG: hypothetical protein K6F39_02100 [Lachnospiraceae bacterium]|nr:hypothetical protein [Lachnospiraceae bacterium]